MYESKSDNIEGIYGPKGFYFQQRRGQLNLRGISSLDIDKLVREVDVDTLQAHIENLTFSNLREDDLRYLTDPQVIKLFKLSQLTIEYLLYSQEQLVQSLNDLSVKYSSKKKSLSKKRRELIELQESTKHLRNQVKAKKQNINTLEDLLKETNRAREREYKTIKQKLKISENEETEKQPSVIKFFVNGTDGLCVEFTERRESLLSTVMKEARKIFLIKKYGEKEAANFDMKLVFHGKMLLEEHTLAESGIKHGDTILVITEDKDDSENEGGGRHRRKRAAPDPVAESKPQQQDSSMRDMLEFFSKQQDAMREFARDMRNGWENAITALASNRSRQEDANVLQRFDEKWSNFENTIQQQMDQKLGTYQAMLSQQSALIDQQQAQNLVVQTTRRRFELGPLESDNEELDELKNKLRSSQNRMDSLEKQMADYKAQLEAKMRSEPQTATTATSPIPAKMEKKPSFLAANDGSRVPTKSNKWNAMPLTNHDHNKSAAGFGVNDDIGSKSFTQGVEFQPKANKAAAAAPPLVAAPKEVNQKVDITPMAKRIDAKPEVKEKPPTPEKAVAPAAPVVVKPKEFHIRFPYQFNADLRKQVLFTLTDKTQISDVLEIAVPECDMEDSVFAMRKAVGKHCGTGFSNVSFVLEGKTITMGMDAERLGLTFDLIIAHAGNGSLTVKLKTAVPLTNAQIDSLIPAVSKEMRKSLSIAPSDGSGKSDKASVEGKTAAEVAASAGVTLKKSRTVADSAAKKKRREWDDESEEEVAQYQSYQKMRSSLDDVMQSVSDMERMTDDELREKRAKLKEVMPAEMGKHLDTYRSNLAGVVSQAISMESESEGYDSAAMRRSGGSLRANSNLRLSVNNSLNLKGGLLRVTSDKVSTPGGAADETKSVGTAGEVESTSTKSSNIKVRRSVQQFDEETGMFDSYQLRQKHSDEDAMPTYGSLTASRDLASARVPVRIPSSGPVDFPDPRGKAVPAGGNVSSRFNSTADSGKFSTPSASRFIDESNDSLLYSPSVSAANNSRVDRYGDLSRLDAEEDFEESELYDRRAGSRDEGLMVADRKGGREMKLAESVDSAKMAYYHSRGGILRADSSDKAAMYSTIGTEDDLHSGGHMKYDTTSSSLLGNTLDMGKIDLDRTVDSDGEMLLNTVQLSQSDIQRLADQYERDAAKALDPIDGGDDQGSDFDNARESPVIDRRRYSGLSALSSGGTSQIFQGLDSKGRRGRAEDNAVRTLEETRSEDSLQVSDEGR